MSNIQLQEGFNRLSDGLKTLALKVQSIKSIDDLQTFPSKEDFELKAKNGEIGTYLKNGHPVILVKYADLVTEHFDLNNLITWIQSQLKDTNAILNLQAVNNNQIEDSGDLSTQQARDTFITNAKDETFYSFLFNGDHYSVRSTNVVANTSVTFSGSKTVTGANGIEQTEYIHGQITSQGISTVLNGLITSSVNMNFINLNPLPTEAPTVAYMEQKIADAIGTIAVEETDPTWRDLDGTQATQFNPSQIIITLTDSGIQENEHIQFLLGSNVGNMVLDAAVTIYGNAADAARNGSVAAQYKWYAYKDSATTIKFVMEDNKGALTDQAQTIEKIRRVSPNIEEMTAHYTSQADILKKSVWLGDLAKGQSLNVPIPTPITIENLRQLGVSVSNTTDWDKIAGWDKVTPMYISVTTEDTSNTWWVEYKIEAIPGDITKLKVTNWDSGNQNTKGLAYRAHWLHFKGGK